ncbi:MAG: hypothetical protein RIT45_28 [Pseudomonadota bacterium]|jgi:serine/threonine-protein kinase
MMRLCPLCGQRTEEARCPTDGTATLVLAQNPDSRLTEGAEINGRYRIGKLIGQGGFGAVYRATALATGNEIAIKVLGVSLDNDEPELIQRFYAEAQITAALKHPNTIRVFDFGQTDSGALYIAMELLTGQALNELLRERRRAGRALTQEEAANIASQTLRSLGEAHAKGLVHRDLKPHNIFLNEVAGDDPVVKVLDFGIAKRLGSNLTGTGQAFGTPTYMSPEQAQNRGIDARSDLYSLACVMYQCVTGSPPFEGDNPLAVLLSHVTDTPQSLKVRSVVPLSDDFIAIIERALAKSPDDRYATAQEMRAALDRCGPAPEGEAAAAGKLGTNVDDEATRAYSPAPSEIAATTDQGREIHPPVDVDGATAATPAWGSGYTEAFMLRGDDAEQAVKAADDEPELAAVPTPSKGGKGILFALVSVLVLAGGAFALLGGNKPAPAPVEPSPVAPAEVDAGPAPTAAADAVAAAPGDAGAVAATADVAPTPAAPDAAEAVVDAAPAGPVQVELKSEPAGASVRVDGKEIGKTPLPIEVKPGDRVRVLLMRAGYRDREVLIEADQAPSRLVELTEDAKPKPRPKPRPRPKPTETRPKPTTKSALEERL